MYTDHNLLMELVSFLFHFANRSCSTHTMLMPFVLLISDLLLTKCHKCSYAKVPDCVLDRLAIWRPSLGNPLAHFHTKKVFEGHLFNDGGTSFY